ncbi:5713_t:CDS:2, partial [Racocetra fulgida]
MDDDTFLHLIHYYRDIQDLPRERAYYGNALGYKYGTYTYMGGAGYTLSRDLVIDIAGSQWASSHVYDDEDWRVGEWVCHVAREKKYFVKYIGFTKWVSSRQNPFHDFDEDLDDVKMLNAMIDMHSEYEKGLPMVRVIRNSTAEGLITKKELPTRCWTALEKEQMLNKTKEQMWNQTLENTYKNWFYEAWDFKEGIWYGHYGP